MRRHVGRFEIVDRTQQELTQSAQRSRRVAVAQFARLELRRRNVEGDHLIRFMQEPKRHALGDGTPEQLFGRRRDGFEVRHIESAQDADSGSAECKRILPAGGMHAAGWIATRQIVQNENVRPQTHCRVEVEIEFYGRRSIAGDRADATPR